MPAAIPAVTAPSGAVLHLVPFAASRLPPVGRRDLEAAFEAARKAALAVRHRHAAPHGFRFAGGPDILLDDADAAHWVDGIAPVADLSTAHGVSVCLRLLALVSLCAAAPWARRFLRFEADGLDVHPALLRAAAASRLTESGGFDETTLRTELEPEP